MVMGDMTMNTDLLVIGGGPGGYSAAFRGADLGLDVILVDPCPGPGGICLHNGCIPSKTLLHLTELIADTRRAKAKGVTFGKPVIDLAVIRKYKQRIIDSMADGLVKLASSRDVMLIQGRARFNSSTSAQLEGAEISRVRFKHAIIATGSRPQNLPGIAFVPGGRIMDSSVALTLTDIPKTLLVVGGGYVGLEIGSIYAELGSRVTLMEKENRLLTGVDSDLLEPLQSRLTNKFADILLNTRITDIVESDDDTCATFRKNGEDSRLHFDKILLAIGRIPNSDDVGLEHTGVKVDGQGFIKIDEQQKTADKHIFAVGDIAGGVMLAHKAQREGKIAAEVICTRKSSFDVRAIPAIVYTDPQICWCGITEEQAKTEKIPYSAQKLPWKYSGRAQSMGMIDGFTKLLLEPVTGRIIGAGITGRNAESLIAEAALAIEMGALAEDLALTLHPHPTLSETLSEAAEGFLGNPTHLLPPS